MTFDDMVLLALHIATFACGMALLSHRFFAAQQRWLGARFGLQSHLPGIVGLALMLFGVVSASSLGWAFGVATVLAGVAVAYLYVYVLRQRIEAGLLGPVFAMLAVLLPLGDR
ncbi:hypothetical protein [Reyranella sp.]|uniref:hypothetical protein n=1 Tax=Reyranella sp. TaxID=1929291 RepID=UPI003BAB2A87